MAVAGRKVRWSLSTDGGTTYTPFAGSTSDGIDFTNEPIDITDKDDSGNQTLLDDTGKKSASGTSTIYVEDTTILALVLDSPTTYLHDLKLEVEGLYDVTGQFFIGTVSNAGEEGASAATMEVSLTSSGAITYTAAP